MVLYLAVRWFLLFVAALAGAVAVSALSFLGVLAISGMMLGLMVFRILFMVAGGALRYGLPPPEAPVLLDLRPYFWRHERLWKLLAVPAFNGTPFKPVIWRMFGVKVGKRLYDAG